MMYLKIPLNPLNAELNSICHLLALLGAHHILHVSRIRVNYDDPLYFQSVFIIHKVFYFHVTLHRDKFPYNKTN
jgi:hypothetical protein